MRYVAVDYIDHKKVQRIYVKISNQLDLCEREKVYVYAQNKNIYHDISEV